MWAPGLIHGGFNGDLVTEIKRAVSVPVIAVGRFTEPQYAELLVKQGRADLIAFGRQSIADPDLPNKALNGHLETLAPCIGCLLGCVPNMFAGKPITCAVNPCVGREAELTPTDKKKKVVVVGGGMVGCEAAEYLAERGHQVGIIEMKDVIAGDVTAESRKYIIKNFEENHVQLCPGAKVGHFYTNGVDYTLADGTEGSLRGFNNVVLAMGSRANGALKETAEKVAGQVLVIGEAAKAPGNAVVAVNDAFEAALQV